MATTRHACSNCSPECTKGFWTMEVNYDKDQMPMEWCCTNCNNFEPIVTRTAKAGGAAQLKAIAALEKIEGDSAKIQEECNGSVYVIFPHWFQSNYKVGARGKVPTL